jgi:hypothetical protein
MFLRRVILAGNSINGAASSSRIHAPALGLAR